MSNILNHKPTVAIIGNGSFATALTKVLTDNGHNIIWWMRSEEAKDHLQKHHHNPHYLSQVYFTNKNITYTNSIEAAIEKAHIILLAVPSAFIQSVFSSTTKEMLQGKFILSAIKGIVPSENVLLNEFFETHFEVPPENYCCITGPCHAEEIAAEKLSYLTFSSHKKALANTLSKHFQTHYLRTITSTDVYGVQFAAILKNIYALGAGIAHGLDYGDNFLSVYNTNCFAEMKVFMKTMADYRKQLNTPHHYITSAYLGDLLVTSYSLHSRNRRFGKMIGKGYTVEAAKLELNMVAEGYYAAKCIFEINQTIKAATPIANELFAVLWKNLSAKSAFKNMEGILQ
jgi:glycerol-3-phosphate dehydrogenase (NAD(P)+)